MLDCEQVASLQAAVRQVEVEDSINEYLLDIVEATRRCDELQVGVSTRGALALYRAAQAAALVAGRPYVVPDDVKQLAVPVLAHRVIPKGYLHGGQREAVEALVERLVEEVRRAKCDTMFRLQTTIRREGWYYLLILAVVFGGAVFKEVNLLLILAGMLLGPLLLNWEAVRTNLRGLRIERKLPPGLSAGDRLSVTLSLTNARRRLGAGRSWSRTKYGEWRLTEGWAARRPPSTGKTWNWPSVSPPSGPILSCATVRGG